MYFQKVTQASRTATQKRLRILAQLVLTGFTIVACFGAFYHLNADKKSGAAYAAAPHLRTSPSQIRTLAKTIYKNERAIKGQTLANLVQVFYQPELMRTEGAMVLWQYRNKKCVMDLYFKVKDGINGSEKVQHFETRFRDPNRTPGDQDTQTCVRSLLKSSAAPRMVDVSTIFKL